MKKSVRLILPLAFCIAAFLCLIGCGKPRETPSESVLLHPAPPGPVDLGPATGLSIPPADAYVFDLKYRAQTGATDDIGYYSFWGYGGDTEVDKRNAFAKEVSTKASGLYFLQSPSLKKREWAAVEYKGRDALALYFDLNGDGHFSDDERILPTTQEHQEFNFITPDFMQTLEGGAETLCRVLVQVSFYDGSTEPNCLWSPPRCSKAPAPCRASRHVSAVRAARAELRQFRLLLLLPLAGR
jgi:hypothetical protein